MEARRFKDLERTPDPSRKDMVRLEVTLGREVFGRFLVTEGGALVFGSTLDADVPVDEPELDGNLVFRLEQGTLRIASRGRLRINGVECQAAQLLAGDRVEIGGLVFVVARVTVEDTLADRPSAVCPRCRRSVPVALAEAGGKLHTSCGCSGRVSATRPVPALGGDPRASGVRRSAGRSAESSPANVRTLMTPGWIGQVTPGSSGYQLVYTYRVRARDEEALDAAWPGLMARLSTVANEVRSPRPHWAGLEGFSLDRREVRVTESSTIARSLPELLSEGLTLSPGDVVLLTRSVVELLADFESPESAPELAGEAIFFSPEPRRVELHGLILPTITRELSEAPGLKEPDSSYLCPDPESVYNDLVSLRRDGASQPWRISLGRLGVLLYRGLVGRSPFKEATLRGRLKSRGEIVPIRESGVTVSAPIAMLIERFVNELSKTTFKHFKEVQSLVRTIDSLMSRG